MGHMFSIDLPSYMNYGSLGTFIGHEINHGFDSHVRLDLNGAAIFCLKCTYIHLFFRVDTLMQSENWTIGGNSSLQSDIWRSRSACWCNIKTTVIPF